MSIMTFSNMDLGYPYKPNNENLKKCIFANKRAYENRGIQIKSLVEKIDEFLLNNSFQSIHINEVNNKISFLEKECMQEGFVWHLELQAYKFLKVNKLNKKMLLQGLEKLSEKAKVSFAVAELFNKVFSTPSFQKKPLKYIKELTNKENESQEVEHKKFFKRINSIGIRGSFSEPGNFYIKL